MESVVEELFQQFILDAGVDSAAKRNTEFWKVLQPLTFEQRDAVEGLRLGCALMAFREGLRLGLLLGTECGLPPRPLP